MYVAIELLIALVAIIFVWRFVAGLMPRRSPSGPRVKAAGATFDQREEEEHSGSEPHNR